MGHRALLVLSCLLATGCWARALKAETIFDVNFNDGLIPATASVIDDQGGSGVQVVPSAGDLNDTPLLLSGTASDLASVAFYFPQVTEGRYLFSWDSLVLTQQPEDKDTHGRDQSFVVLLADQGAFVAVPWSLEYDSSGQMMLGCCDSSTPVSATPVGSYVAGQGDHFELSVDLGDDTYGLKINGQPQIANASLLYPAVRGIAFRSPGRFFLQDPAPLVVDNILVKEIPEPSTISLLCIGALGVAVLRGRRRWSFSGGLRLLKEPNP